MKKTTRLIFLFAAFCKISLAQVPIISSITPSSASLWDTVTINGSGFSDGAANNSVYIGSGKAHVIDASTTSIRIRVSPGNSSQPVSVTNAAGLTGYSNSPYTVAFPKNILLLKSYFASPTIIASGSTSLITTDIDGDAKPEIIVTSYTDTIINIAKNMSSPGSGITIFPYTPTGIAGCCDAASADIDGDGKPDIICGSTTLNKFVVLRNTTALAGPFALTFAPRIYFDMGSSMKKIAIADFDKDGKPDIACINSAENSISFRRNTSTPGAISFDTEMKYFTTSSCSNFAAKDFNNNHLPDLLINCTTGIEIINNTSTPGSISFNSQSNSIIAGNTASHLMAQGDIDGNAYNDIVIAIPQTDSFYILINQNSGTDFNFHSTAFPVNEANVNFTCLNISDLTGDGKQEILLGENSTMNYIFENISTAGGAAIGKKYLLSNNLGAPLFITGCDLNYDGKQDVFTVGANYCWGFENNTGTESIYNACPPQSSFTLAAGFSPGPYQWQVDTGNGFVNLIDDSHYSGTSANTLSLTNIPSAFYGYRYKCVTTGNETTPVKVKFVNYWLGRFFPSWETPGNWSCGVLPDMNTDVVVPSNSTMLLYSNVNVRSIKVGYGATVTVNEGASLTVTH